MIIRKKAGIQKIYSPQGGATLGLKGMIEEAISFGAYDLEDIAPSDLDWKYQLARELTLLEKEKADVENQTFFGSRHDRVDRNWGFREK